MSTTSTQAPASPAPASAGNSAPNKGEWTKEIHTPDQTYNANVPVDLIERDEGNRMPEQADVEKRAAEIEAVGLIQPIVLRQLDDGKYKIIAGETRWKAFLHLKRQTIPAFIRKGEADAAGDVEKRLVENLGRTDLPPVAKARGFRDLIAAGRTQKEVGALFGLSQPVVGNAVRMLALPEPVLMLIDSGKLSEAHGVALASWAKWPRVVTRMAELIGPFGMSAKTLAEWDLPFGDNLVRDGLVAEIRTKAHYYHGEDTHPVYKLPEEVKKSPDFIPARHPDSCSHYIIPEDPALDLWTPEKKKQDEARAAKLAAKTKKQAEGLKSGKLSQEQIKLRETKEKNKKTRAENAAALMVAMDKLKRTPSPTSLLVAILVEGTIAGGYSGKRIVAAAEAVGVTLPKGLIELEHGGHGMRDVELMLKMDVMDLTRVAVAVMLTKQTDDANKNASGMPGNLELVMNSKVPSYTPAPGDTVGWRRGNNAEAEGIVLSVAEANKGGQTLAREDDDAVPVRITKTGGINDAGTITLVFKTSLRLIRAGEHKGVLIDVPATPKAKPAKAAKPGKVVKFPGGKKPAAKVKPKARVS